MRFQGSFDLPRGKTLCIVFIAQIEWVAKIGFLIGNDLETSEVLYSALFCIISKERAFECKDTIFSENIRCGYRLLDIYSKRELYSSSLFICSIKKSTHS